MELIIGMAGALLSVILFGLGAVAGYAFGRRPQQKAPGSDPIPEAEQKKREALIKEQEAFRAMMRYNAETAYNMGGEG
jgi:hypothetical protein